MARRPVDNPAPLTVAASLVTVEGVLLVLLSVAELASLDSSRVSLGLTTGVFFAAYGAGLLFCAWHLTQRSSWSRSPVVLAQLLQLGVAWNFRGGDTTWLAILLAVVALVVLVGVMHPQSIAALSDPPAADDPG
jgi:hypothetical protein